MVRLLKIAAHISIVVAVAAVVLPFLMLWWADDPPSDPATGPVLFTHYFVEFPTIAGFMLIAGIIALVLFALARILDRLDDFQRRINHHD